MKILVVTQYFWPEPFLINDIVQKIARLGHEVEVFTGKPNYPDGDFYHGYHGSKVQEEHYSHTIKLFRVPIKPRKKGKAKNLIVNYMSFVISGLIHAPKFAKNKQFDMIMVYAPSPITSAIPAILLKWLTKAKLTIWIQDIWPESIKATGFVSNRFLLKGLEQFVKLIYYFSDKLLVQSKAFITPVSKLAPLDKIIYYPNSAIDFVSADNSSLRLPSELNSILDNNFCIIFAGNIGKAQSVETLVKVAKRIEHLNNIRIVMVGSGSMTLWLSEQIKNQKIDNMILAGRFPASFMPLLYSKSQALLVTLNNDDIFRYTVPSKIQTYLSAGRPIIAAINGEGARIISEAKAGLCSASENDELLAKNIETLFNMSEIDRKKMGDSAREYYLSHFEMDKKVRELVNVFEHI